MIYIPKHVNDLPSVIKINDRYGPFKLYVAKHEAFMVSGARRKYYNYIIISVYREKLQIEIAARERAEKKQQEYEDRIKAMQEEMERSQANLHEAQEMIRRLEEQLKQLQAAKEELEKRQNELQAMMERLEESKNMEAAERQKLEDEIQAKQAEVLRIQQEVDAKDSETKRLQEEVENARRKEEELKAQQLANATKGHLEENQHDEDDELMNGDVSRDLDTDENIVDPIEDRRTLAERNERLQDQLMVS